MEREKQVRDLMLPLYEYAVVDENATLIEAMRALDEAQRWLPPGRHLHRAVLVCRGDEIIGRLGHFAFLEALLRRGKGMFEDPLIDAAGVSEEMVRSSMDHLRALAGDIAGPCERGRHIRVRDVMRPATLRIHETASLVEAIEMLVGGQTLSLLVTRGTQVVGVLRSADVFTEMARELRACEQE